MRFTYNDVDNNTLIDLRGLQNASNENGAGLTGGYMTYDGINDYTNFSNNISLDTTLKTYILWWKPATLPFSVYGKILSKSSGSAGAWLSSSNSGSTIFYQNRNTGGGFITSSNLNSSYNCIAVTHSDSTGNAEIYTGNDATPDASGNIGLFGADSGVELTIGGYSGAIFAAGQIATMGVFNRILTGTEIKAHCDSGKDFNPYALTGFFSIDLNDIYTGTNLTNFTAYVGSNIYNDSGSGIIVTNITNANFSEFNITVEKEDYFNSSYIDFNVSSNLNAEISATNVTLRIVLNNTNVTANISLTLLEDLNNSINFTTLTGFYNINPPSLENITFKISCNRSVFENRTFTLEFLVLDENEYVVYVEPTLNTISFYDVVNSSAIANATINLTYPISGDEIQLTTNATGTAIFSYVKNNVVEFGNYTFEFDKQGYNLITIQEELNSSVVPVQLSYNISRSQLNINIFNRETSQLLTGVNVSLNLLGVFQNSTTNGTFVYSNIALTPQDYTLQAISTAYVTEQTTFTYDNQGNLTINVYLLNSTGVNTGLLFLGVIDQYYFRQINADSVLMEYSAIEKGFIKVSECLTNTNGECVFNIELNVKTYIITASKIIDGELFTATTGTAGEIIRTDQESRRLILRTDELFEATDIDNLLVAVSESFINNISSIDVGFKDINNIVATVCVEYFIVNGFSKVSVQQDCTSSSDGVANLGVSYSLNRSNQYKADIYNLVDSVKLPITSYNYNSLTSLSSVLNKYGMARYLILGLVVSALALCLYLENIALFFIIILFTSWPLYGLFSEILLVKFIVAINIICVFGIYLARKKRQQG